MQNSTQLRGIHQAMFTWSQDNKHWFPGITSTGQLDATFTTNRDAITFLIEADYFEADYAISPGEVDPEVTGEGGSVLGRGSYAVLEYRRPGGNGITKLGRLNWRDTQDGLHAQAIVLSDRQLGDPGGPRSI